MFNINDRYNEGRFVTLKKNEKTKWHQESLSNYVE